MNDGNSKSPLGDLGVIGIIPARFASTRFPGKPLVDIAGKSMIQRVYEQASKAKSLSKVVVATDDERIVEEVKKFGGEFVITEQIPRAQSKANVLKPGMGDMVVFTTNFRPVKGINRYYRVNMKHGVSPLHSGNRHSLGIIFHDAKS